MGSMSTQCASFSLPVDCTMARIPSQVCSEGGVVVRTHVPDINPYPGNSIHPSSKELLWLSSEDRLDSIFFMLWLNAECWWWCQQMLVKTIVEISSSAATSRASTLWHASVSDKGVSELMLLFQIKVYLNWYRCLWSTSSLASSSHGSWNIWWRYLHSPLPPNQREVDFLSGQPEAKSRFVNLCPLMHEENVSRMCPPLSLCLWWWRHTWWRWWWWWWPLAGSHHSILLPQLSKV